MSTASANVISATTTAIPTTEELVARTRKLIPLLRERAEEDEQNRKINPDTIRRMVEAGLFRVLQPRRFGGYELGQRSFAEVQMALAEGDMSVAWVYGVVGLHSMHIGLMDEQAGKDVKVLGTPLFEVGETGQIGRQLGGDQPDLRADRVAQHAQTGRPLLRDEPPVQRMFGHALGQHVNRCLGDLVRIDLAGPT